MVNISGPVTVSAATDTDGNYSFAGLPEGTYTVSLPGHVSNPASR